MDHAVHATAADLIKIAYAVGDFLGNVVEVYVGVNIDDLRSISSKSSYIFDVNVRA